MPTLTIKKSQIKTIDWEELWLNALPEIRERLRIQLGQQRIMLHFGNIIKPGERYITSEAGFFSSHTGGNLLKMAYHKECVLLWGDSILYQIEWDTW